MIRLDEVDLLRRGEISSSLIVGGAILTLTVVLFLLLGLIGTLAGWEILPALLTIVLFVGGMSAAVIFVTGWERGHGHAQAVIEKVKAVIDAEIAARKAALPPVPALPAALPEPTETIRVTNGSRVEDIPRNLVHGFDPRDLEWLAQYLANGNKWTEAALEKMPLPYSKEKFGKAEGNTPYMRLFGVPDGLMIRAGVITGRGGPGNAAGKLAVTDAAEMVRRIKGLM